MNLHPLKQSATSVGLSGRPRMNLPKAKKFGGIALPVHLKDQLDQIVELHTDAYRVMNSTTKESISDQLEIAVELLVTKFTEEHGPLPIGTKDRVEYVKRLAESLGASMRGNLRSSKSA